MAGVVHHRSDDDFDLHARMFAPLAGVSEDPATGSANLALGALLAYCDAADDGEWQWRITQGVEIGRPSVLNVRACRQAGRVSQTWVSGPSVMVAEGVLC